jgi:hypothetical protein
MNLAGNKCARCGSVELLEFNHIDRTQKKMGLSGKDLDGPWQRLLEEFDKCELLCKSCHLEYTRGQWARKELVAQNRNTLPYIHGTMRMYHEVNCRCELCRLAKKMYRAKQVRYSDIVK